MPYKDTQLYKKGNNFSSSNDLLSLTTANGIANIILDNIDDLSIYSVNFKEAYNNLRDLINKKSEDIIAIFSDILYILSSLTNDDGFTILQNIYESYSEVFVTLNATILTSLSAMSTNNIGTSTPYILYGGDGKSNISYKFDSAYSSLVTVTTFNVKIQKENVNLDSGYVSKVEIVNNGKVKTINLESNGQISKKNINSAGTMTYSIDNKKNATISISASESYESSGTITVTTQNKKTITGTITSSNSTGNSALVQSGLAFNSRNKLGQSAYTNQAAVLGSTLSIKQVTNLVTVAVNSISADLQTIPIVAKPTVAAANSVSALQVGVTKVQTIATAYATGSLEPQTVQINSAMIALEGANNTNTQGLIDYTTYDGKSVIQTPELSNTDIDGVLEDFIFELSNIGQNSVYVNIQDFKNQSYTLSIELTGQNAELLLKFTINTTNDDINKIYEADIKLDGNNMIIANFYNIIYNSLNTYNFIPNGETPKNYHYYELSSFTGEPNNSFFTLNMKVSKDKV